MNDRSKRRAGVLNRWKRWWEWWTRVEAPDEETARVGWVFSILMLISIGIVSAIAGVFILEWVLGIMPLQIAVIAIVFPVFFIPFSVFCWWIARRGRIRQAVTLYVWANFVGIALAIFVFDGLTSSAWILYIWTVTIAGTLIAPGYALGMVGLVVGYYLLLSVLQAIGWYQPPLGLSIYGGLFSYVAFTLIILVSTVGGGTYLNTRSLQEALGRLRAATRELEEHRRTLEQRVAQRTADLARRTAQLEAASTVARRAAEIRDLNILLDETVRLISERFGFYHVGIFLLDEAGEYAVLRAASSE
ncbi:MAG: DUF4164 domain-containing protein, partial [Anaerolineae bacterium]|nr:DUF4164 domain-containing protein [Anaerolineae bacterium]